MKKIIVEIKNTISEIYNRWKLNYFEIIILRNIPRRMR